jgi:hypothetical protein
VGIAPGEVCENPLHAATRRLGNTMDATFVRKSIFSEFMIRPSALLPGRFRSFHGLQFVLLLPDML